MSCKYTFLEKVKKYFLKKIINIFMILILFTIIFVNNFKATINYNVRTNCSSRKRKSE